LHLANQTAVLVKQFLKKLKQRCEDIFFSGKRLPFKGGGQFKAFFQFPERYLQEEYKQQSQYKGSNSRTEQYPS